MSRLDEYLSGTKSNRFGANCPFAPTELKAIGAHAGHDFLNRDGSIKLKDLVRRGQRHTSVAAVLHLIYRIKCAREDLNLQPSDP